MPSRRLKLVLAVLLAIVLGLIAGYAYRTSHQPTPEERARGAAERLKAQAEKATK